MFIDVQKFIDELNTAILFNSLGCPNRTLNREVVTVAPFVTSHMAIVLDYYKIDPRQAHVLVGQQILSHHYGELLAIRFRSWIEANYFIGCDDAAHDDGVSAAEVGMGEGATHINEDRITGYSGEVSEIIEQEPPLDMEKAA